MLAGKASLGGEVKTLELRSFILEPLFVPEATPALKLLERFRTSGVHIALVIDEYSSIQGVVTLTDILAAIVGELPAAGQSPKASIVERDDGSWPLTRRMKPKGDQNVRWWSDQVDTCFAILFLTKSTPGIKAPPPPAVTGE